MSSSLSDRTKGDRERESNPLGGVTSKYPGPRARISRDQKLPWWRRVLPVIASHRAAFITAIGLSFVSLVFQVLVPNMLSGDIDYRSEEHTSELQSLRHL